MDEEIKLEFDDNVKGLSKTSKRSYILTLILGGVFLTIAIFTVMILEAYFKPWIDIAILDFNNIFEPIVMTGIIIFNACAYAFIYILGIMVCKLLEKKIHVLEFTFKVHRKWHSDDDLYFFEYFTAKEDVSFKATFNRSIYGGILVLGIAILVMENFLTIPDLQDFFWVAGTILIFVMFVLIPVIIIFLYCSPLITKEINLYFHDKKNRTVRNVGGWLDDSLQLFAAVDIILTVIIIIDTTTINAFWLVFIMCLTLGVFSLFLVMTAIFNRNYHSKLSLMFKQYLAMKYKIPVRKVDLPARAYFCENPDCKALIDYINLDTCDKCGHKIAKCAICGDVLEKKLENEMFCPECGVRCHEDEFISWVKMRGTCPSCKKEVDISEHI